MNEMQIISVLILIIIIAIPVTIFSITLKNETQTGGSVILNESYCARMKSPEMKKTCNAMLKRNISICNDLTYFDSYCYEKVIDVHGNLSESFCKNLPKYDPQTDCYVKLAKVKKDPKYCEKAKGKYQKCSWELAELLNKPELCKAIEVDCEKYQCFALASGNISYCEQVPDHLEKRACYAKLQKNVSFCGDYIPEKGEVTYIPSCMHSLAKKLDDKSICWNITTSLETRWKCLVDLGTSEKICKKAKSQFWKDYCLVEFLGKEMTKDTI